MTRPGEWTTTGHTTATKCGHAISTQEAINDRGEHVTRTDGYPDPDNYTYDALDLCHDCYCAKMNRRPMSFTAITNAFR